MKLLDMQVNNFRAISGSAENPFSTKINFDKSDIIFLLGPNNFGKSALLAAYDYLVTPKQKAELSDFHGYSPQNCIDIRANFLVEDSDQELFQKKGFGKWVDHQGIIRFRKLWTTPDMEGQKQTYDPELNDYVDNGFGGLETHFTAHAPTAIRIPAMDSPAALTKWVNDLMKKTVLKGLHHEVLEVCETIISQIRDLQQRVIGREVVGAFGSQVNKLFSQVFPDLRVLIDVPEGQRLDLAAVLEKEFSITVEDSRFAGKSQEIMTQGHGVIRQAMFNILGVVKKDAYSSDWGVNGNRKKYMLLFEEPEIYLHPHKIRLLRDTLYSLCHNSPFQILCASHSPVLIDLSQPHNSLVRLVRDENNVTTTYQVDSDVFGSAEDEKKFLEMVQRFDPHVCETFFAPDVIVVEGPTESVVLRSLLEEAGIKNEIFVLNAWSKMNIPFFQKILTHFHIKHHVIHDIDSKYVVDPNGKVVMNKDGTVKKISAWKLNDEIWKCIEAANAVRPGLSQRFVMCSNFEDAHQYEFDAGKGKPLSAYHYAKELTLSDNVPICTCLRQILGQEARTRFDTPGEVDALADAKLAAPVLQA